MATLPENALVKRASAILDDIQNVSKNAFNPASVLTVELKSLSFVVGRLPKWLARAGVSSDLRNLVEVTLDQVDPLVKSISAFPPHGSELTKQTDEIRPKLTAAVTLLLSFGVGAVEKDEDAITAIESKVDETLAAQKREYDEVIAMAHVARLTAEAASEKAFESAKKVGITVQMTAFAMARDSQEKLASTWEKRTAAVAALLLCAALYEIIWGSGPPDSKGSWYVAGNLSHYLARALAVSLISYVLVLCTKNFRAARHNEVVNGHRAWALATFDTLRSPNNKELDNAIMLRVADAVFTPRPTGYDESDASGTHVTELAAPILKKLTGG